MALETLIGRLGPSSPSQVRTAVCSEFLSFARRRYQVPTYFVPETYAELRFLTSLGTPVFVCLGKYVLPGVNQRRLLIVGDEGYAILDLSSCTLSIGLRDTYAKPVLISPKLRESKYVAVLRSCLDHLKGQSPFKFDSTDICLRANELALCAFSLSRAEASRRTTYRQSATPREIFDTTSGLTISNPPEENGFAHFEEQKLYYEHQYDRVGTLEDQSFKMSTLVFAITSAVLVFLSRVDGDKLVKWWLLVGLVYLSNVLAIGYVLRVSDSIWIHRQRAKKALKLLSPDMYELDRRLGQLLAGRIGARQGIHLLLHVLLLVASFIVILCKVFKW